MASLFPAIIGSRLVRPARGAAHPSARPDARLCCDKPGALYLTQSLSFRGGAPVGAPLRATVTATRVAGRRAVFDTRCVLETAHATVVVDGTALALLPAAAAAATRSKPA